MSEHNMCMTGYLNNDRQQYDPWEHLSNTMLFPGVTFRFSDKLPFGTWGLTNFAARSVTLATGMDAGELRSTLAHEIMHLERGQITAETEHAEELVCDLVAASRLVPIGQLVGLAQRVEHEGREAVTRSLVIDEKMLEVALELEAVIMTMMNKGVGSSDGDGSWRAAMVHLVTTEAARS